MAERLAHYYHVYAVPGWPLIVGEHLSALHNSGLLGAVGVVRLGIVGERLQRQAVKDVFQVRGVPLEVVAEADIGWEQVTLTALRRAAKAKVYDAVMYAHTKGITYERTADGPYGGYANEAAFNDAWRQSMTAELIGGWRDCVPLLNDSRAVGCHWLRHAGEEVGSAGERIAGGTYLFGGNFWWARATLIRSLTVPRLTNRYDAELWFGQNGVTNVADRTPGWPSLTTFTKT